MSDPQDPSFPRDPEAPLRAGHQFMGFLGVQVLEKGEGRAVLEMTVAEAHLRSLDILHGGVLASLLDSAIGLAAGTRSPKGHYTVTIQLNVNFIRPAWKGEVLRASGEVQHVGRQTAVGRGEVRTAAGALVGAASGTFMYLPYPTDRSIPQRNDEPLAPG